MARAAAGVQSELDVESNSAVVGGSGLSISHWTWIWFALALLVIIGFHIRMFGHVVPPAARFP